MTPLSPFALAAQVLNVGAQANAQETAAQQKGLQSVEQFGVFGSAAQGGLAAQSQAVFQNQSPLALAALNQDSLGASLDDVTSSLGSSLTNAFVSPVAGVASQVPSIAWLAIGGVVLFLILRRH